MISHHPKVSIIIVNFNGKKYLESCLASLAKIEYPSEKFEVIIVDNHSIDDSVSFVKRNYPNFHLLQTPTNVGFARGNNIGIDHATGEYIVLLNNDTVVDSHWLLELVRSAKPKNVGVVTSKLSLANPYIRLKISISHSNQTKSLSPDPVSDILLQDIIPDEKRNTLIWYNYGFEKEQIMGKVSFRNLKKRSEVYLPISENNNRYKFIFHNQNLNKDINVHISLSISKKKDWLLNMSGKQSKMIAIDLNKSELKQELFYVVQNAGNIVLANGYGKDCGSVLRRTNLKVLEFYEKDNFFFKKERSILSACGAAMLIKKEVIQEIGKFDDRYFMYYEDIDFSLRAWQMGWEILYAPKAKVLHEHRASTGKNENEFFIFMTEKNHLFLLVIHFPILTLFQEYQHFLLRLVNSMLQIYIFKFTDKSKESVWLHRTKGRLKALHTFHQELPRLFWERFLWKRKFVRDYNDFKRFLY